MSKEIFLYSGDNKYQAYVELADSTDRFGCPDHSLFKLIEKRNDDEIYLIAEARDRKLETEKDQRIAELEKQLDQANEKLGKLEDILEKYGIESVEELKDALENKIEDISNPFLQGYVRAFFKDRLQYVEFERDIWKRACELACEREDDCYVYDNIHRAYEFYQQAKKEGNDERN